MIDQANWSRESVMMMAGRTVEFMTRHGLAMTTPCEWDLHAGTMAIGGKQFRLITVGTVAGDSFQWAWADDSIPANGKAGIERVKQFGDENGLGTLTEPSPPGGMKQAKECLAIAGRILDAPGAWIAKTKDGAILFVLHEAA